MKSVKSRTKKNTERKSKKRVKKEKKPKVLRQTPSLLTFLQVHDDYILTKHGYMDILQVGAKDLYSLNSEDLTFLVFGLMGFYRSYYDSFKFISLSLPTNLEKQKTYWEKKKSLTNDPIRLQFIDRKLYEFDFLESDWMNREYLIFLYADTESVLQERKAHALRSFNQTFPLEELSAGKKKDILFVLNNQNTPL